MNKAIKKPSKERMIHIRLDEHTHRELKILAVSSDTTIQSVVEDLIKRKVAKESGATRQADPAKGRG